MQRDSRSAVAALAVTLAMSVVGTSIFGLIPLITSGAAETLGFTSRQVGALSFAISLGSGVSALLAVLWVRTINWRRAALVALSGMLIANGMAMLVHGYGLLLLLQSISGFSATSVCCLALTMLSDRKDPARDFGLATLLMGVYQAAALLAGPYLLRIAGLNGVLALLAATCGGALPFVHMLPTGGRVVTPERTCNKRFIRPATILALVAFCSFYANTGAYWTYVEVIGGAQGISGRLVANCVSAGVAGGMIGSAAAWVLGERWGTMWPLCVATFMTVIAGVLLNHSVGVAGFATTAVLHLIAWNYSYSYQLSLINSIDVTGKAVAVTLAVTYLGTAGGAGIAALFITPQDYRAVGWLVGIAACISTILFAMSLLIHKQERLQIARGTG